MSNQSRINEFYSENANKSQQTSASPTESSNRLENKEETGKSQQTPSDKQSQNATKTSDESSHKQTVSIKETRSETDINSDNLPDRIEWDLNNPRDFSGSKVILPANPDDHITLPGDCILHMGEFGYVYDGLEEYLEAHDCREIEVPSYYSRMDNFETIITKRTANCSAGARGVTSIILEEGIRLAAGSGGFSQDRLSVYVGAQNNFVVEYENDAYLLNTKSSRVSWDSKSDYSPTTHEINGMMIPEDAEPVARGLEKFLSAVDTFTNYTVTGYKGLDQDTHKFTVKDNEIDYIHIKGYNAANFAKYEEDPSTITGELNITTQFDEEYTVVIDESDIEYSIGDELRNGHVIGFAKRCEDPRVSSRASLSGKIKVYVATFYLKQRTRNNNNTVNFSLKNKTDRVARLEPQNKDYDPINNHIS